MQALENSPGNARRLPATHGWHTLFGSGRIIASARDKKTRRNSRSSARSAERHCQKRILRSSRSAAVLGAAEVTFRTHGMDPLMRGLAPRTPLRSAGTCNRQAQISGGAPGCGQPASIWPAFHQQARRRISERAPQRKFLRPAPASDRKRALCPLRNQDDEFLGTLPAVRAPARFRFPAS
jgi:hypothetical protein